MASVGGRRYIDFRIADLNGDPVAGLKLSDFSVIFTRDNSACSDTLSLTDLSDGRYTVSYTPTASGHDYVELYSSTYDQRILDADDVLGHSVDDIFSQTSGSSVELTYNYGGADYSVSLAQPQTFVVYAFPQADWDEGVRDPSKAAGYTTVASSGQWTGAIGVPAGTYALVAISPSSIVVLNPSLVLP